jgi:hypothetical protein
MEKKPGRGQRIAAVIGICLLLSLYLAALICAFIQHPVASSILHAAIFATIVIPVFLYAFKLCVDHARPSDTDEKTK